MDEVKRVPLRKEAQVFRELLTSYVDSRQGISRIEKSWIIKCLNAVVVHYYFERVIARDHYKPVYSFILAIAAGRKLAYSSLSLEHVSKDIFDWYSKISEKQWDQWFSEVKWDLPSDIHPLLANIEELIKDVS